MRFAKLVRRETCAEIAAQWDVGPHVALGLGEARGGGRKKAAILKVYIVDAAFRDEAAVAARLAGDPHVRVTPDTSYRPVAKAPAGAPRPVVIGAGPCGLFAGLIAPYAFSWIAEYPILLALAALCRPSAGGERWPSWSRWEWPALAIVAVVLVAPAWFAGKFPAWLQEHRVVMVCTIGPPLR